MTDEQIKQNAEAYAHHKMDWSRTRSNENPFIAWKEGFEDGAHSRDEEIKKLEKKVSALETVIVTARDTLSTQEAIIKDLRNPWNRIMHWLQMSELPKRGEK